MTSLKALDEMIEYVHATPVRKELAMRPSDWKWSSASWFESGREGPLRLDQVPKDWAS
jgi:hypothetical protein